jgi:hypothetical protein
MTRNADQAKQIVETNDADHAGIYFHFGANGV